MRSLPESAEACCRQLLPALGCVSFSVHSIGPCSGFIHDLTFVDLTGLKGKRVAVSGLGSGPATLLLEHLKKRGIEAARSHDSEHGNNPQSLCRARKRIR